MEHIGRQKSCLVVFQVIQGFCCYNFQIFCCLVLFLDLYICIFIFVLLFLFDSDNHLISRVLAKQTVAVLKNFLCVLCFILN